MTPAPRPERLTRPWRHRELEPQESRPVNQEDRQLEWKEALRDKTRALKLGMMRELLTGRIRLI